MLLFKFKNLKSIRSAVIKPKDSVDTVIEDGTSCLSRPSRHWASGVLLAGEEEEAWQTGTKSTRTSRNVRVKNDLWRKDSWRSVAVRVCYGRDESLLFNYLQNVWAGDSGFLTLILNPIMDFFWHTVVSNNCRKLQRKCDFNPPDCAAETSLTHEI